MSRLVVTLLLLLAPVARGQDLSGTWDVTGVDPAHGAYAGSATVQRVAGGYAVTRLVRLARPLPDGRTLALSWHAVGRDEQGGLRVEVDLRQQDFVAELSGQRRGAQHQAPLRLAGLLRDPSGAPVGALVPVGQRLAGALRDPAGGLVADDTWVKTARQDPPHPGLERRRDVLPPSSLRGLFFALFRSYHTLPEVAPYVPRPEFQAAAHFERIDTTGFAYTRANPDHVLVVQKVPDPIAVHEERLRADAFRWRLHEKARAWDVEMIRDHVEPSTGMLGGVDTVTGARLVHYDSALHQGVWVASQAWRHEVTRDPQALANVELGVRALIGMVDAPGRPDEFARALQEAPLAPASWTRSPVLPGVAYLHGGNNDMLHGIEYGFVAAERVLPAGHPLLAQVGERARSLVLHHDVAKRGKHALLLGGVAARLTGDTAVRDAYRRRAAWSPLELLWLVSGEGTVLLQEVSGRSGPHLATCTMAAVRHLGATAPSFTERLWRRAADAGLRRAFAGTRINRPGNLAAVAALAGAPGAPDVARAVLAEVPYPRPTGSARVDHSIDPAFCVSPYPFLPWKLDWMTDPGRRQSLEATPLWEIADSDNYWKEGPYYSFRGHQSSMRWSSQDWLHAYWSARLAGALTAAD